MKEQIVFKDLHTDDDNNAIITSVSVTQKLAEYRINEIRKRIQDLYCDLDTLLVELELLEEVL